jgi:hypothetical protein
MELIKFAENCLLERLHAIMNTWKFDHFSNECNMTKIVPIYKEKKGMTAKIIRALVC